MYKYEIFIYCIQHTQDLYWKNIFLNLANGKPPYLVYFYNDYLCCKHKNKEFSYNFREKDSKTLHDNLVSIFYEKLNMVSYNTNLENKIKYISENFNILKWKNIKRKKTKELLLELYSLKLKKEYNLSIERTRKVLSDLITLFTFKLISSTDVIIENNKIIHINNFDYKDINMNNIIHSHTEFVNESQETKLLSSNWLKYITKFQ